MQREQCNAIQNWKGVMQSPQQFAIQKIDGEKRNHHRFGSSSVHGICPGKVVNPTPPPLRLRGDPKDSHLLLNSFAVSPIRLDKAEMLDVKFVGRLELRVIAADYSRRCDLT